MGELSGIKTETISPPLDSEIEITLIGTGGGYGESIVFKLSENDWFIVDSCVNPDSKEPLALDYLTSIGIDYERCVKMIICTHWHDDHIKGLSRLLELCKQASFGLTRINDVNKFLLLTEIDNKINSGSGVRATKEFSDCLKLIKSRSDNKRIKRLNADTLLYTNAFNGCQVELFALSPSESAVLEFDRVIASHIDHVGKAKRSIVHYNPNKSSVALLIKFGNQRVILGSDLELGSNSNEGWLDVLNNVVALDEVKAQLYKIPHHGSSNAYDKNIFNRLVEENSVLKLTPWNLNSKLPSAPMVSSYKSHSSNLFITSALTLHKRPKPIKRERAMAKIINEFNPTLDEVKFTHGIIQSRFDINGSKIWKVNVFGSAILIN